MTNTPNETLCSNGYSVKRDCRFGWNVLDQDGFKIDIAENWDSAMDRAEGFKNTLRNEILDMELI